MKYFLPRPVISAAALATMAWIAPAFGDTHTQSTPGGTGNVPLVSIATSNPRRCSAATSAPSSCRSGSPPVQTT